MSAKSKQWTIMRTTLEFLYIVYTIYAFSTFVVFRTICSYFLCTKNHYSFKDFQKKGGTTLEFLHKETSTIVKAFFESGLQGYVEGVSHD